MRRSLFGRVVVSAASVAIAHAALACPETTDQLPWDGRDAQASMDFGGAFAHATRAADDFFVPQGNGRPWSVREVDAVLFMDWVPTTATFGMEIFANSALAALPGTRTFGTVGAASVTDLGPAVYDFHQYRVRFSIPYGACTLTPNRWHWVSVYAATPIPTGGAAFFGTSGNGDIQGAVSTANTNYPTGPWQRMDQCCIGRTDLAFRIRSRQTLSFQADINCSGALSVQDLFSFLEIYFAEGIEADFNFSGARGVQDIFDFLACYFSGC